MINKHKRLDLIQATYNVTSVTNNPNHTANPAAPTDELRAGASTAVQTAINTILTDQQHFQHIVDKLTLADITDAFLSKLHLSKQARYSDYQQMLVKSANPDASISVPSDVAGGTVDRNTEAQLKADIFKLLYNPSYKFTVEITTTMNDKYENLFNINRRRKKKFTDAGRSTAKGGKMAKFEPAEQPTMQLVQIIPSSWFVEFLSVFEASFAQNEAPDDGSVLLLDSGGADLFARRRTDLPSPGLMEHIFYLKQTGLVLINPTTGKHPVTSQEIAFAQLSSRSEDLRTYTMDINNLLTVFASNLFGYTKFNPSPEVKTHFKSDSFADFQLLVEYALLLIDSTKVVLFDYLRQPGTYVTDPIIKRELIAAIDAAVQQLLYMLPRGHVFKTNQRGKIQLCQVEVSRTCAVKIESVLVPDRFCKHIMSLQIPNLIQFKRKLARASTNALYTGLPENMASGSQEVLELMSKISQKIYFDVEAVDELTNIYENILRDDPAPRHSYVEHIDMKIYQHDGTMHSRHDLFHTLASAAANIRTSTPKNSPLGNVDSTWDFVNSCMCALTDKKDTLAIDLPRDENPVLFSSTHAKTPGLLFTTMLSSTESMDVGQSNLGMMNPSYFRDGSVVEVVMEEGQAVSRPVEGTGVGLQSEVLSPVFVPSGLTVHESGPCILNTYSDHETSIPCHWSS